MYAEGKNPGLATDAELSAVRLRWQKPRRHLTQRTSRELSWTADIQTEAVPVTTNPMPYSPDSIGPQERKVFEMPANQVRMFELEDTSYRTEPPPWAREDDERSPSLLGGDLNRRRLRFDDDD